MWERPLRRNSRGEAPPTFWRNGVMPAAAPRIAAGQATDAEPASTDYAVRFERFQKVSRTARLETASTARSSQKRQHRREEQLVTANKKTREKKHQGARIEARSARRNHSSLNSALVARAAAGCATSTSQNPRRNLVWCVRTISRKRRRTRFRTTAPPIFFDVT